MYCKKGHLSNKKLYHSLVNTKKKLSSIAFTFYGLPHLAFNSKLNMVKQGQCSLIDLWAERSISTPEVRGKKSLPTKISDKISASVNNQPLKSALKP